jgi:hypothetical protein
VTIRTGRQDFPTEQLLTSSDTSNKIYFVSKAVFDLINVRNSKLAAVFLLFSCYYF